MYVSLNSLLLKEYEDKIRVDFGMYVSLFIPSDRKYRCCMLCTAHIHMGTFISHFMPLMYEITYILIFVGQIVPEI